MKRQTRSPWRRPRIAVAIVSSSILIAMTSCSEPKIATPSGEVTDPSPYLARFSVQIDDSEDLKRETLGKIWDAIPTAGRLDGLIEVANTTDERCGIAMAAAVLGDREGAAKKARERVVMKGVAINPGTMSMAILAGCDTLAKALDVGRELLKNESPRARTTGHYVLVYATNWPVEPNPRYSSPTLDVDPSVVEQWRALDEGTWTERKVVEECVRRFLPMEAKERSSADEARMHFLLHTAKEVAMPPTATSEEKQQIMRAQLALTKSRDPKDLDAYLALIPENLTWDQMTQNWSILRNVGVNPPY